jgi:hypothetical protein
MNPDRPSTATVVGLAAMHDLTSLPVVTISLDSRRLGAAFDPDLQEHDRRSALGVAAVTSRPLLHGLWLLPTGIPVPATAIPAKKLSRLRDAQHLVIESRAGLERTYSPPGAVRAVYFTGSKALRSIERAARFTPIVERVVITRPGVHASQGARSLAREFGIGLIEALDDGSNVILSPRPAVLGVPAVYRWWIAELAYASWLQQSAQPVS